LGDGGLVRIRRRRTDARAFVRPTDAGRRLVRARGDECSVLRLREVGRLDEREELFGILEVVDAAERGVQTIRGDAELRRGGLDEQCAQLQASVLRGVS